MNEDQLMCFGRERRYAIWTYVFPGVQAGGVDRVLVESLPLLELVFGELVVLFGVPLEHLGIELDTDSLAELAHDRLRVVEEVVCVHKSDGDFVGVVPVGSVGVAIGAVGLLTGDLGPNDAGVLHVVKDAAEFVVASLFRHEVVEACDLVERRDGAAPVAGDAVLRVADQETEVELAKDL